MNVQRRDLTAGQRALVAAKQWGLDGYSKGGQVGKRTEPLQSVAVSQKQLVKHFRLSNTSLTQARDLLAKAPDLAAQVESCALTLTAAYTAWQERQKAATRRKRWPFFYRTPVYGSRTKGGATPWQRVSRPVSQLLRPPLYRPRAGRQAKNPAGFLQPITTVWRVREGPPGHPECEKPREIRGFLATLAIKSLERYRLRHDPASVCSEYRAGVWFA
jgi:hypothetical protein